MLELTLSPLSETMNLTTVTQGLTRTATTHTWIRMPADQSLNGRKTKETRVTSQQFLKGVHSCPMSRLLLPETILNNLL
jgi:hypothetical protein